MAFREIVTKAVIAKGKKKYKNEYEITVDEEPTTVLGCWIINHDFSAHDDNGRVKINGSFDANVWYSYDNDTKTKVASKHITYDEIEKINIPNNDSVNRDIIIRSLKQPTCTSAKEDKNIIKLEVEKELGIEIVGDTKVKISSVDKVDPNYINKEIVK